MRAAPMETRHASLHAHLTAVETLKDYSIDKRLPALSVADSDALSADRVTLLYFTLAEICAITMPYVDADAICRDAFITAAATRRQPPAGGYGAAEKARGVFTLAFMALLSPASKRKTMRYLISRCLRDAAMRLCQRRFFLTGASDA